MDSNVTPLRKIFDQTRVDRADTRIGNGDVSIPSFNFVNCFSIHAHPTRYQQISVLEARASGSYKQYQRTLFTSSLPLRMPAPSTPVSVVGAIRTGVLLSL